MTRRVEIVFPVEDEKIKKELEHVLDLEFKDNVKAHILQPDGTYVKPDKRGQSQINSQMEFCIEATEKAALHKHERKELPRIHSGRAAEDIKNKKQSETEINNWEMPWKAVELPWHFFSGTKNPSLFVAKAT